MALGFDGPLLPGTPKTLHMRLMGNWTDMPIQYGLPSNSQVFARFLREAGFEGVLYRSTRGQGVCIALFLDRLDASDSFVELSDNAPPDVTITRLDSTTFQHLL